MGAYSTDDLSAARKNDATLFQVHCCHDQGAKPEPEEAVSMKVAGPQAETDNGSVGLAKWSISQSDLDWICLTTTHVLQDILASPTWLAIE